ncbi:MAG TPA: type I restriction endonuclease subunit M [Pirellulaceae bacterium]|nr:type I restriction endonuclease subunit M [Pirellulaceae bacterium]
MTQNAASTLPEPEVSAALARHAAGDWGDVDEHDRSANEMALKDGSRLFSVYHAKDGTKFWIITEANRSSTTVLLPEDY